MENVGKLVITIIFLILLTSLRGFSKPKQSKIFLVATFDGKSGTKATLGSSYLIE